MKQTILLGAVLVAVTATFIYAPRAPLAPETIQTLAPPDSIRSPQAAATATVTVGENTYSVNLTSGETVLDAMRALASTSSFTFAGRDYPSLGFFVDSINGQKNAGGRYWILYVNDVSATNGVSSTVLQAGDLIEWKYEKGY